MRLLLFIGIVTLHAAMAFYFPNEAEESNPASSELVESARFQLASVTHSLSEFAGKFYQVVANDMEGRNHICSPISVSLVLSMLTFGARRNTEKELYQTLALPKKRFIMKEGFQLLIDRFNGYTEVELLLANKIYLSKNTINPEPAFTRVLKNSFNSDLAKVNFAQSQTSRNIINEWVERKTNHHIKNIIQPGDVGKDTALVLVNAIYFKGEWVTKFDPSKTSQRSFLVGGTKEENRPTMYSKSYYNYGKLDDVDAHFVELPYKSNGENDKISMFIILPNQEDGLKKLEENFAKVTMERLTKNSDNYTVEVYLPKFKIESEIDLQGPLQELGLTDMFTSAADFTGIASGPPLQVSKIKQQAFIEIDEKGSESAAATFAGLLDRLLPVEYALFVANHPFIGIIATTGSFPVNLATFRYTGKE